MFKGTFLCSMELVFLMVFYRVFKTKLMIVKKVFFNDSFFLGWFMLCYQVLLEEFLEFRRMLVLFFFI